MRIVRATSPTDRHRPLIDAAAWGIVGGVVITTFGWTGQLVAIGLLAFATGLANGRIGAFVASAGAVSATIFTLASVACVDRPGQNCAMDASGATLIGISVVLAVSGLIVALVWPTKART